MTSGKHQQQEAGSAPLKKALSPLLLGQAVLDMVRSVDLDGVVSHRREALSGLNESVSNLAALLGEAPSSTVGVRQESVAAVESQPSGADVSEQDTLVNALGGAAFARRLAHVFVTRADPQVQPLKRLPGVNGLPMFHACIAPAWSPVDGAHGIFVASGVVISAVYPYPFSSNRWYVRQTWPYETREELLAVVQKLMLAPSAA